MSEDEISWTNTLYPQYQVYENHLNTFIDRSWPILLHQNEVTLAEAGFFYSGKGHIVICAFCGIHLYKVLPKDDPLTENKKFNNICKFVSLFQDINNQSSNPYRGLNEGVNSLLLPCHRISTC